MPALQSVILADFARRIAAGGQPVVTEAGRAFKALVVAAEADASFSIFSEQNITDRISFTCRAEEAPKTGEKLQLGTAYQQGVHAAKTYCTQGIESRPNGPIVRVFCYRLKK